MILTNILLVLIAVLLLARIALQVWQGKKVIEMENCLVVCNRSQYHIREVLEKMQADRWELVSAHLSKNGSETLFFTRKKINNYLEK